MIPKIIHATEKPDFCSGGWSFNPVSSISESISAIKSMGGFFWTPGCGFDPTIYLNERAVCVSLEGRLGDTFYGSEPNSKWVTLLVDEKAQNISRSRATPFHVNHVHPNGQPRRAASTVKAEPNLIRIFTLPAHTGHQYELAKIPDTFWSFYGLGPKAWAPASRPFPKNAKMVYDFDASEYDLAVLFVDQDSTGLFDTGPLPKIIINNGSPVWEGESRLDEIKKLCAGSHVVFCSEQSKKEWGELGISQRVILHGLDDKEWPLTENKRMVVGTVMGVGRPAYYNEKYFTETVKELGRLGVEHEWIRPGEFEPSFDLYRKKLGSWSAYFSPTLHSPMPRARSEAMLMGVATFSLKNHDFNPADMGAIELIGDTVIDSQLMVNAMRNPILIKCIGLDCRDHAIKLFHVERFKREWRELIDEVLNKKPKTSIELITDPSAVIVYIHVPGDPKHEEYAKAFVGSYLKYPPESQHSTMVICQGGLPTPEMQRLLSTLPNTSFRIHDDSGWDIGGFQMASRLCYEDFMVCFGGSAYFQREGWLKRMKDVWKKRGPGLYGSLATFEVSPHLNTTGFWCSPSLLASYPIKVVDKKQRYDFEHGPNAFWKFSHKSVPVMLATWGGEYEWKDWRKPDNIYRRGDQSNCLSYWHHISVFNELPENMKEAVSSHADTLTDPLYVALMAGDIPQSHLAKLDKQSQDHFNRKHANYLK